jgi:PAS domain S-box-containing protein
MIEETQRNLENKIRKLELDISDLNRDKAERERCMNENIALTQFSEDIFAKILGLNDEAEVFRTIGKGLRKSKKYKMIMHMLTEDGQHFETRLLNNWVPEDKAGEFSKALDIKNEKLRFAVKKSDLYSSFIKEGKTRLFKSDEGTDKLFPGPLASIFPKAAGDQDLNILLTSLVLYKKIKGALVFSFTELDESFIPVVESFSDKIARALEQAKELRERNETEERLRKSEEKYKHLVILNPGIIYRLDSRRRITFISPEVKNMLGYTAEELKGKDISEIVFPDDLDRIKSLAPVRTGPRMTRKLEIRLKKKGNGPVYTAINWVQINATGVYDDDFVGDGKKESRGKPKGEYIGTQGNIIDIAPRKKAEQELQKAHDQMDSIFNNLDEMLFSVDVKNNKLLAISDACEELTGYKKEDFFKDTRLWFKITHPEDKVVIDAGFPRLFRGEAITDEYRIVRKDGKIRWVVSKIKPQNDEAGDLVYFDGFVSDISEQKNMKEALHESEHRFRELFNHMQSGVVIYRAKDNGADFEIIDFNKASESIEHKVRKDVVGRMVTEVFPGVKPFGLFDVFQRVFKTGKAEYHPVSIYKDDRIEGWRENYVYRLPSGEIVALYEDVTERKKSEEALRKSEGKYRQFFNGSLDAVFTAAPDGKIIDINPSGLELFGYKLEDVRNMAFGDMYVSPDEKKKCRDKLEQNGMVRNCEVKLKRHDGKILDCVLSVVAQIDNKGEVIGYHGVVHDTTDLKILGGLLPICSHCKKIRDDKGYWSQVEKYISQHSRALFSHSICPDCAKKYYSDMLDFEK